MSEETAQNMDGERSFEERVFARFDALDSNFRDMDARMQKLKPRSYDTKPVCEQALKGIIETRGELSETRRGLSEQINQTRQELSETRRELSKRLDRIEAIAHETRADLRDAEDHIERLEPKPTQ